MAHVGLFVDRVALDAGDGLMPAAQRIGFAVLRGSQICRHKALGIVTIQTRRIRMPELPCMRVFMAGFAGVRLTGRTWIALCIGVLRIVAGLAGQVAVGRIQRKTKTTVQLLINPPLSEGPAFVGRPMTTQAIPAHFGLMRRFVTVDTGFSFDRIKGF